jgi:hypothetical protein
LAAGCCACPTLNCMPCPAGGCPAAARAAARPLRRPGPGHCPARLLLLRLPQLGLRRRAQTENQPVHGVPCGKVGPRVRRAAAALAGQPAAGGRLRAHLVCEKGKAQRPLAAGACPALATGIWDGAGHENMRWRLAARGVGRWAGRGGERSACSRRVRAVRPSLCAHRVEPLIPNPCWPAGTAPRPARRRTGSTTRSPARRLRPRRQQGQPAAALLPAERV